METANDASAAEHASGQTSDRGGAGLVARFGQLYRAREKQSDEPLWNYYYRSFPAVICAFRDQLGTNFASSYPADSY